MAIQTVLSEARYLNITEAQLERLALEFKQEEVVEQLKLPPESSSRTLRASAEEIAEYQGMEATALADAAVLRKKASGGGGSGARKPTRGKRWAAFLIFSLLFAMLRSNQLHACMSMLLGATKAPQLLWPEATER